MVNGLENFEIYVQTQPFPNSVVAAHPCSGLEGKMSQSEMRAAFAGYLVGMEDRLKGMYVSPFFASQASRIGILVSSLFGEQCDFLSELAERGHVLPADFDPVIFAYEPSYGTPSLRDIVAGGRAMGFSIERQLAFYFCMTPVEKCR